MNRILIIILCVFTTAAYATNPVVSNVVILGEGLYNATPNPDQSTKLTGNYDFSDADGDTDASTYAWYVDTDDDGQWSDEAAAGTDIRYTVTSSDVGHNIYFVVSPEDSNGETDSDVVSGASAISSTTYTDFNSAVNVNITSDTDWLNGYIKQNKSLTINGAYTLTIYGDFTLTSGGITIDLSNGASLIVKGQLITENNMEINVDATSEFIIESGLDAKNNSELDISGTMDVNGDVLVEQNASFTINDGGAMDIAGDLETGDNAVLDVEGDVTVDGNFTVGNNSDVTVDGSLPEGGTLTVGGDLNSGTGSELLGTGPVTVGGGVDGPITGDEQLPVELLSFAAFPGNDYIQLQWTTASEINNHYFTVERSLNGVDYTEAGKVYGAGNSSSVLHYQFIDHFKTGQYVYYRLKQTDYDGTMEVFTPVSVKLAGNLAEPQLNIYPNPISISDQVYLSVNNLMQNEAIRIIVMDYQGRIINHYAAYADDRGNLNKAIPTERLVKGIYFIRIGDAEQILTKKLVVQ